MKISCLDCKLKSVPFQQLNAEQLQLVDENRSELSFRQGELLLKQGSLRSHIIYIRTGFAKIYYEKENEIIVLGIATPGSFVGIQWLYGMQKLPFSVEALVDTDVCLKSLDIFKQLILENPRFASEVINHLSRELTQTHQRMFSLVTKQVNARFAELLLFMRNVMYQENPFKLTISKREIAGLISTSPENLSRLIASFKKKGIIRTKASVIEIIDENALGELCLCDVSSVSWI
jgi:CRP/FNR family transcriptional regulator